VRFIRAGSIPNEVLDFRACLDYQRGKVIISVMSEEFDDTFACQVTEAGAPARFGTLISERGFSSPGWVNVYIRTVGGIQLLYAAGFAL
jgi:hypothetical protein